MVKCKDCAFLSLKSPNLTELLEADSSFRAEGIAYGILQPANANGPVCFRMVLDLRADMIAIPDVNGKVRALEVISRDLECDKFVRWFNGYSPKEIAEKMYNDQQLKIAEERKAADEERAAQRRREDREWQVREQERRESLEWKRRLLLTLYGTIFTAVVGGISGYIGFLIKGNSDQQVQQAKEGKN